MCEGELSTKIETERTRRLQGGGGGDEEETQVDALQADKRAHTWREALRLFPISTSGPLAVSARGQNNWAIQGNHSSNSPMEQPSTEQSIGIPYSGSPSRNF